MRMLLMALCLLLPALLAGCTEAMDGAKGAVDETKQALSDAKAKLDETKRELEDVKARYDLLRDARVLASEQGQVRLAVNVTDEAALDLVPNVTGRTGPVATANLTRIGASLALGFAGADAAPEDVRTVSCEVLACAADVAPGDALHFRLDQEGATAYRYTGAGGFEAWDDAAGAWSPVDAPVVLEFNARIQHYMAASDFADRVGG